MSEQCVPRSSYADGWLRGSRVACCESRCAGSIAANSAIDRNSCNDDGSDLLVLAKIQSVALIIFKDELFGSPSGFVYVPHQVNTIFLESLCRCDGIVGFKVEVKVFIFVNKRNGGSFSSTSFKWKS